MEKNKKKRLAVWTPGGVGGGLFGQGFPYIVMLLEKLSLHYEIHVYSVSPPNKDFIMQGYKVYSGSTNLGFLRFVYLMILFFKNHLRNNYDALFSFWGYPTGFLAVLLGKITNRPSIVNILGGESANLPQINYGHLRKPITRRLVIWTCNKATTLIALTNFQLDALKEYGLNRDGIVIPWGADQNLFKFFDKGFQDQINIVHVANLTEVKDQETLIKTFDLIQKKRKAQLRIVGPDFLNGKIQRLVAQLNLDESVEFTGPQPYSKMASHFEWAHVIILTSLSEGQNNSLLEAALCGVLLAGTRVGIIYDLGSDYAAMTSPGDYKELASKLLDVYANETERKRMISNSLQWSREHDFEWTANQLIKAIRESIK